MELLLLLLLGGWVDLKKLDSNSQHSPEGTTATLTAASSLSVCSKEHETGWKREGNTSAACEETCGGGGVDFCRESTQEGEKKKE